MTALHAAFSDLHCGNRGYRDRSEPGLLFRLVDDVTACGVTDLWALGDIFERMKFSANAIMNDRERLNLTTWRIVAGRCNRAGITLHLLPGNHDENAVAEFLPWLTNTIGFVHPIGHDATVTVGPFTLMHGDCFDAACAEASKVHEVAQAATWIAANTIERVMPWFPEKVFNPVAWFSPAANATRAGAIGELAKAYAKQGGLRIVCGHTHQHDIEGGLNDDGKYWQYVNCGAMSDGAPYSWCLFDEQGHAQLVRE